MIRTLGSPFLSFFPALDTSGSGWVRRGDRLTHLNDGFEVAIDLVEWTIAIDLFICYIVRARPKTVLWGGTDLNQSARGAIVIHDGRVHNGKAFLSQLQRRRVVVDASRGFCALGHPLGHDFALAVKVQGRDALALSGANSFLVSMRKIFVFYFYWRGSFSPFSAQT